MWDDLCFGYHADLHLKADDLDAGARALPDELEASLRLVRPDWVQIDSKGHPGFTSWKSEVPAALVAPHLGRDAVAAWREATRRLGVPLVCHYSGFIDLEQCRRHPEWRASVPWIDPSQPLDDYNQAWVCPRSSYWDEVVIPELVELATKRGADGFWEDGDIWGFHGCWCERCRAEFTRMTGIAEIPRAPGDAHWREWWDFQFASAVETIGRVRDAVKRAKPSAMFCSNWLDSVRFPVPGEAPVDWLSGDTEPCWCLDKTRVEVRWLANRGKSWDLMSWPHLGAPNFHIKSEDMLCQEAAQVAAAGGRYCFCELCGGIRTSRQPAWRMRRLGRVGDFVRERAPFCRGAEPVPEIAVLRTLGGGRGGLLERTDEAAARLAVLCLLDAHYGVDLLDEPRLLARLDEFRLVVLPECGRLDSATVDALVAYVRRGGRLIATGLETIASFPAGFFGMAEMREERVSPLEGRPWTFCNTKDGTPLYFVGDGGDGVFPLASPSGWGLVDRLADGAEAFGALFASYDPEDSATGLPAGVVMRHCAGAHCADARLEQGAGSAAAVPAEFFAGWARHYYLPAARDFMARLVREIMPERAVEVEAPAVMDVMFRRKGDALLVHLLNRSTGIATHPDRRMVDEIPAVGPVRLRARLASRPQSVRLLPEGRALEYVWTEGGRDGIAEIAIDSVRIHSAVEIK